MSPCAYKSSACEVAAAKWREQYGHVTCPSPPRVSHTCGWPSGPPPPLQVTRLSFVKIVFVAGDGTAPFICASLIISVTVVFMFSAKSALLDWLPISVSRSSGSPHIRPETCHRPMNLNPGSSYRDRAKDAIGMASTDGYFCFTRHHVSRYIQVQ